jgi:hypothetical protein
MGRAKDSPRPLLCTVLFATTLMIMLSFIVFGFILFVLQNSRSEDEVIRGGKIYKFSIIHEGWHKIKVLNKSCFLKG